MTIGSSFGTFNQVTISKHFTGYAQVNIAPGVHGLVAFAPDVDVKNLRYLYFIQTPGIDFRFDFTGMQFSDTHFCGVYITNYHYMVPISIHNMKAIIQEVNPGFGVFGGAVKDMINCDLDVKNVIPGLSGNPDSMYPLIPKVSGLIQNTTLSYRYMPNGEEGWTSILRCIGEVTETGMIGSGNAFTCAER